MKPAVDKTAAIGYNDIVDRAATRSAVYLPGWVFTPRHQAEGNYQQVGRQPDEHILFSFQKCGEQKETPGHTAGCFLYAKKTTAGTLAGDHWQRCGWPNRFYFTTGFWKSQKNIKKVLKKYKKSIDICCVLW